MAPDASAPVGEFRAAGRALFSLGLVKGAEGNLSTFDGGTLWITRTGATLGNLGAEDLTRGSLDEAPEGASMDLEVHLGLYRGSGPGAVVHAHPPGTVPEGNERPGEHGVYALGSTLEEAVARVVASAREASG